jgi:S1-C subfamily serine protease
MNARKLFATLVLISTLALAACGGAQPLAGSASQAQNPGLIKEVASSSAETSAQRGAGSATSLAQTITSQPSVTAATTIGASFEAIYQTVNPSVVNIEVTESAPASTTGRRANPFGNGSGSQTTQALGSGFVWDTQGHIVTNNHVVSGATTITVTFSNGATYDAKLVGADPNADLAVIQVNAPANLLVPITLGDTSTVQVGEIAIAIGNPFGLQGTMTQGIISGLQRSLPTGLDNQTSQSGRVYNIPDIIQTDASINPGNSGGVLVDISGKLIGVTAAIASSSNSSAGIGFVIPTEIVQKVVPVLISRGSYQHPYLGVAGTDVTPDIAKAMGLDANTRGVLIDTVTAGGPAAKAGLLAGTQQVTINGQAANVGGDIVTAIDGQPVKSFNDLGSYLFVHTEAGQTVTLTLLRGSKTTTVKVTTGVLPAN